MARAAQKSSKSEVSKGKKKIDKKNTAATKAKSGGKRKEDGLGSATARSKNASKFSSFLPSGGVNLGLGSLAKNKVRFLAPREVDPPPPRPAPGWAASLRCVAVSRRSIGSPQP